MNPFSILWAEHDTIEGYFLEPVDNLEELAAAMYEVCSDIVDQRSGGMEALIKSLRETRKMRFWWD